MLAAAITKELKLLSRDLHGVAVLFVMPILFMLIMSAALSSSRENLNPDAQIVLLGKPDSPLNQQFLQALQNEKLKVQLADKSRLADFQVALQRGEADLLLLNPNDETTPLEKEQPLRLWLQPDAELAALQGRRAADGTFYFDTDTPAELLAALQNKGYAAEACRFGFASLESFYLDFLAKQAT